MVVYNCNELGEVKGQDHTNNEQTQSVDDIIWFNMFQFHGYALQHDTGHYRWLHIHFAQIWSPSRIQQLCVGPQNTLKIHGRVLWRIPITTDDFITNSGHCRRLYTRLYTIMWGSSEYTKNTRSCTMTYTDHDRRLYIQFRSLPTTLYTSLHNYVRVLRIH